MGKCSQCQIRKNHLDAEAENVYYVAPRAECKRLTVDRENCDDFEPSIGTRNLAENYDREFFKFLEDSFPGVHPNSPKGAELLIVWDVAIKTVKNQKSPRYRVKDIWHPSINKGEELWVYSDHPNFNGNVHEFFGWVAAHNGWKLDGVQTEGLLGGFE